MTHSSAFRFYSTQFVWPAKLQLQRQLCAAIVILPWRALEDPKSIPACRTWIMQPLPKHQPANEADWDLAGWLRMHAARLQEAFTFPHAPNAADAHRASTCSLLLDISILFSFFLFFFLLEAFLCYPLLVYFKHHSTKVPTGTTVCRMESVLNNATCRRHKSSAKLLSNSFCKWEW